MKDQNGWEKHREEEDGERTEIRDCVWEWSMKEETELAVEWGVGADCISTRIFTFILPTVFPLSSVFSKASTSYPPSTHSAAKLFYERN